MKLVLFTPVSIASAIARVSWLVTQSLMKQGHNVVIVSTEQKTPKSTATLDFGVNSVDWHDERQVIAAVKKSDVVIYKIGDNIGYHRGAVEWILKVPGIVCLHDFFVGNLFVDWAVDNKAIADEFIFNWYGKEVLERYWGYIESGAVMLETTSCAPMTEWICSLANGVITHSSWDIQRVLNSCPGPVEVVALPVLLPDSSLGTVPKVTEHEGLFKVMTIGIANFNKRIPSVIRAIGASQVLREKTIYQLAGSVTPVVRDELQELADTLGVKFNMLGEVDDNLLHQLIKKADVVTCLRTPCLEAASASAIEAMLHGKAIIVTDMGFYKEIPESCARKVNPEFELADLQRELEYLFNHETERVMQGKNAATWASSLFCADNYAKKLIGFSERTLQAMPIINMGKHYNETLSHWGGGLGSESSRVVIDPLTIFER
jgi:glycosyltransferase involved in cell wall biosynthesis